MNPQLPGNGQGPTGVELKDRSHKDGSKFVKKKFSKRGSVFASGSIGGKSGGKNRSRKSIFVMNNRKKRASIF